MGGKSMESVTMSPDQLLELIEAMKATSGSTSLTMDQQKELITMQATETAKAQKALEEKENTRFPGLSVYSRLGGEKANPKGELKCPFTWGGFPVDVKTITAEELDLINALVPGVYRCQRSDGTSLEVTVTGSKNFDGKLSKMDAQFPTRGEGRHNLLPMATMLREMTQAAKTAVASTG